MKLRLWNIILLMLFMLLNACSQDENNSVSTEAPLRPVRSIIVTEQAPSTTRTFSGTSRSGLESNLSFRVAGSVQTLAVEVGDQLQAGKVIATLDPSQFQLEAQQARANLSQAEASLRNAEANFERLKGLYENNNVSINDLDSARATAESSKAQVNASRKALELANLNVSYTRLKAAESCSVAQVLTEVNENVTAGQTIVAVNCGERIEVLVAIPESMIAKIQQGMEADVVFSSIANRNFKAVVTEVGVASSSGTTYPVTVTLSEEVPDSRSGLAAAVSFAFNMNESLEQKIVIPAVAVGEDTSGTYVFVIEDTKQNGIGLIKRQTVTIGELTPAGLEIADGLNVGDRVVTAGVNVIRDGLNVLID